MAKLHRLNKSTVHIKRAFVSQFGFFFKDWKTAFFTAIVFVALSLVAGWIPDGLSEIISVKFFHDGNLVKGVFLFAFGLLILVGLTFLSWRYSEEAQYDVFEDFPDKKKVLIPFLSNVRGNEKTVMDEIEKLRELSTVEEKIEKVNESSTIKSWRMPLEAIKYHKPRLERVVVITSDKSSKHFNAFKELLKEVFGKEVSDMLVEKKVKSFENIKELFNALNEIYKELREDKFRDRDTIIDITGGQKTSSVAAAFMTAYYSDREFDYVSTEDYTVKSYDVRLITDD